MRKKVLSLILLWAALLALALIYTDRDEYTWRYEGGELAQIVITREEADARQKQADEAMALTQQGAHRRGALGQRKRMGRRLSARAGRKRRPEPDVGRLSGDD